MLAVEFEAPGRSVRFVRTGGGGKFVGQREEG